MLALRAVRKADRHRLPLKMNLKICLIQVIDVQQQPLEIASKPIFIQTVNKNGDYLRLGVRRILEWRIQSAIHSIRFPG